MTRTVSLMRQRVSSFIDKYITWFVLAGYALLTVAMTWPVARRLATHVPGGNVDLWTHRWTYWWIKRAMVEGRNPFYTDLLFHPQGVSLAFHNIAWVNIAAWLPLQALLGGNTAYGLTFLIFSTLNGFAMYLLARELVNSRLAAFISGLVYGFWPYTMSQFGHPNMQVTCWIPLALLYLRRTSEERRVRDAVLTAVFVALTGLTRWQLLPMAAVLLVPYLARDFLRKKAHWDRRTLGLLALIGLLAGALMAPLAAPVASSLLARGDVADVLFTEEVTGQTDLLAYVLPTPYHPLWGEGAQRLYENFIHNKLFVPFLGYTALVLSLYGVVRRWKRARFWLLLGSVLVALALGPQLRVNGQLYPAIPMPYRLLGDLFIVRALRVPNRFNLFLGLPMAVLVSLGVKALTRRRSQLMRLLLTASLGALILLEYNLVPYHTERPVTPDWYERLAQEPGEFAILDLPVGLHTHNKQYMFYQITHRKPLVEGKIARPPREAFAFLESSSFLRQLHQGNVMDPELTDVSSQLRTLAEANVRYIVLHKAFATPEQLRAWRDWLTFAPAHEDEDLIVYRTDPRWGRDFDFSYRLTGDVGLLQVATSSQEAVQGAVVRVDARWGSSSAPDRDYDVCLNLTHASGAPAQTSCTPLSPTWPPSRWGENEIVRGSYALQLPLSLEPGDYSLRITLSDASDDALIGSPASLGPLQVMPLQPMHVLPSTFGASIRLMGYDLEQSPETLSLTLYWQALRAMDRSYKVFVHLTDPTSGDIVAQVDTLPRNWTYPTTRWIEGEVVRDAVRLSVEQVHSGRYQLTVGCYDSVTGQRLEAYGMGGERYPMDAVPMGSVAIE